MGHSYRVPFPLVVVRRGPEAGWFEGQVVAASGNFFVVQFHDREDWRVDEGVILVRGEAQERELAPARLHALEQGVKTFHALGRWRPLDRRAHRRFPADFSADIFEPGAIAAAQARVHDISLGGISLTMGRAPAAALVGVGLRLVAGRATFPAEVKSVVHRHGHDEVHLRFAPLDQGQRLLLHDCIELLRAVHDQDEDLFAA